MKQPSWSVKEFFLAKSGHADASSISSEDVQRLARLAFLDPTQQQLEQLKVDVGNILQCVNQMQSVDTSNVEPLASVLEKTRLKRRVDVPPEDLYTDARAKVVLANAQQKGGSFFAVPKQKDPFEGAEF